jgi:hypothetical protein
VADWDSLENCCGCKPTVGSNPTLSAKTPGNSTVVVIYRASVRFRAAPRGVLTTYRSLRSGSPQTP